MITTVQMVADPFSQDIVLPKAFKNVILLLVNFAYDPYPSKSWIYSNPFCSLLYVGMLLGIQTCAQGARGYKASNAKSNRITSLSARGRGHGKGRGRGKGRGCRRADRQADKPVLGTGIARMFVDIREVH